jgi:hypothetical protein
MKSSDADGGGARGSTRLAEITARIRALGPVEGAPDAALLVREERDRAPGGSAETRLIR